MYHKTGLFVKYMYTVHVIDILYLRDSHCGIILQITIQKYSAAAYRVVISLFIRSDGEHACD